MRIWLGFWLLGLIWGSSFLLIRIGVETIHPFLVVFIRVGIAAVGLCLLVMARRKTLPKDWRTWRALIFIGIGNTAIPFTLISWGEQTVESGLASVLQATAALFGLVAAHFAFEDERITTQKVVGLLMGFFGVVVLASRSIQGGEILTGNLAGQMAIVMASLFYATFTTYSRKVIKGNVEPIVLAAITMLSATIAEGVLIYGGGLITDIPTTLPPDIDARALFAVIGLGFFNTFFAYIIFYELVRTLGAAKATMVTYVVPAVGLILGVLLLNEQLDIRIILGAALIFLGIGIVNLKMFRWLNRGAQPV